MGLLRQIFEWYFRVFPHHRLQNKALSYLLTRKNSLLLWKMGMSWNGAMLSFMEEAYESRTRQLTTYYMNHLIDNENKHDKPAVFSLLEAVIMGINEKLPEFSK